jgi:hypothetical protein
MEVNMVVGLLWYDGDKSTNLIHKVSRAVDYYKSKYGKIPELCFVNPKLITVEKMLIAGVEVRPNLQVLPNHFWLGFHTPSDLR